MGPGREHPPADGLTGQSLRAGSWQICRLNSVPGMRASRAALELLALIALREVMAVSAVSIRNLDVRVKERLRLRAARHGRSMEAEMRAILTEAVSEPGEETGLLPTLLDRFGELGGVELDIPARTARPRAADLG
jgi:antitoxin FitA